jgi:hypothetical protein
MLSPAALAMLPGSISPALKSALFSIAAVAFFKQFYAFSAA